MLSKERVVAAIEFKNPDRIPVKMDNVAWADMASYSGSIYPNDILHEGVGFYSEGNLPGRNMDNWGCEWLNVHAPNLGQVVGHPLGDIAKLASYMPPKAQDMDLRVARDMSGHRGDKYFILGYVSLFERLINLRGFENLLMDIACGEEHFFKMRDMVLDYNMALTDILLKLDPDAVFFADDWGSQLSLMISPGAWRELFLPAYKKMINMVRDSGKHVFFHSDGYVLDILPDLVDAGVNAFWVEFGVNPVEKLRECAANRAAFLSLYDTQILEFSTEFDLEKHVLDCINVLGGEKGGFIDSYCIGGLGNSKALLEIYRKYTGIKCEKMRA